MCKTFKVFTIGFVPKLYFENFCNAILVKNKNEARDFMERSVIFSLD